MTSFCAQRERVCVSFEGQSLVRVSGVCQVDIAWKGTSQISEKCGQCATSWRIKYPYLKEYEWKCLENGLLGSTLSYYYFLLGSWWGRRIVCVHMCEDLKAGGFWEVWLLSPTGAMLFRGWEGPCWRREGSPFPLCLLLLIFIFWFYNRNSFRYIF